MKAGFAKNMPNMPEMPKWLTRERIQWVLILLIALWIATRLAAAVWLFFSEPQTTTATTSVNAAATAGQNAAVSMSGLNTVKIFGEGEKDVMGVVAEQVEEQPVNPDEIPDDAPRSSLPLILTGVISAGQSIASTAMILFQSKEASYKLDDKLPPNNQASLVRVLPDKVIIRNAGRYESLVLFDESTAQRTAARSNENSSAANTNGKVQDRRKDPETIEAVKQFKQMVDNRDVQNLTQVMNVSVAQNPDGSIKGYKVFPGQNTALFEDLGLQRGDVISSVNGISLDNPQRAASMMQELNNASEIELILDRGGEQVTVMFSL